MNVHSNIQIVQEVAAMIRDMLGDDFDDQTFLDTLDGETDVMDMVEHLVKSRVEAQQIEKAMKEIAAIYTARAGRYSMQVKATNAALGKLLDATGERKIAHPIATVSRLAPRKSLKIVDEAEIPRQLCKLTPDNAAIKSQLEAGEVVPGAELQFGEPGISVRVK